MARSRKFQDYTFEQDGIQRTVEIRVRGEGTDIEFFAKDDEFGVSAEDESAAKVVEKLETEYKKRLVQSWEVKVWVTSGFDEQAWGKSQKTSLQFGFEPIAIGKNHEGKTVWKNISLTLDHDRETDLPSKWSGKWLNYSGERITVGEPTPPSNMNMGRKTKDSALIDGTIDNVNSILHMRWQVEKLAELMMRMFSPEEAQKTLNMVRKGTLLLGTGK